MKRYIRSNTTSIIDELNSLPIYNGYNSIPSYVEIEEYESVLSKFPVGTVLGMDWSAGDCYFRKQSAHEWESIDSSWYEVHDTTDFEIARKLAGRGNWCKKPLWIDSEDTFETIANKSKGNSNNSYMKFW